GAVCLFRLGTEAHLAPGRRVGDAEVQLGCLGGPGFIDAGLLLKRAGGSDRNDGVFGRFGRDLVEFTFSVPSPLPRGYNVVPHSRQYTRWEGFLN
ncbi:MAG TPA: hypothetical protein VIJ21_09025, partial [Solirubrobacterales bacterium]